LVITLDNGGLKMAKAVSCFNHIGISSSNLEKSVKFYTDVFGAKVLIPPTRLVEGTPEATLRRKNIFGSHWGGMRIAHLSIADGIGIELFEFIEPKQQRKKNNFEYWKSGTFHFALTSPNIEETMIAIEANGGKVRTECHELFPEVKVIYAEDPDGTIFEVMTSTYEYMNANRS
jgi:catechol 2,3-dioxygenase-like lactoylglutathione lyase family enzyme